MWKKPKVTIEIEWEISSEARPEVRKVTNFKKAVRYATQRGAISVAMHTEEGKRRYYISIDGTIPRRELISAVENTKEGSIDPSILARLFNNAVRDSERQINYIRARTMKEIARLLEDEPYDAVFIKSATGGYVQIENDAHVVNSLGQLIWPPNPTPRLAGGKHKL